VRDAAHELAKLAASAVLERPCEIAFVGGLFRNAPLTSRAYAETRERLPDCTIVEPATDPAEGALILARRT
jgi:hypothetical protein